MQYPNKSRLFRHWLLASSVIFSFMLLGAPFWFCWIAGVVAISIHEFLKNLDEEDLNQ